MLSRFVTNVQTGETVEIPQTAYRMPDGSVQVVDDDQTAPDAGIAMTDADLEQHRADERAAATAQSPAADLVDQVLADPAALARLKAALGVS